ncbi:hypothetical protein [Nocardia arizonensis]|uniref:hypothetical protein n=1 Tax=Nocardia arizonensis TaxID=1141647 RepID=UPI00157BE30F|nr:hypothetical protein [Nocardia arizonensis]
MTSDISPETARRDSGAWRLSWLPDRALTRAQARAGMDVDELLSDPRRVDDPAVHQAVDEVAAQIGLAGEQIVLLLATRILGRTAAELESAARRRQSAVTGHGRGGHRRVIHPPRVLG